MWIFTWSLCMATVCAFPPMLQWTSSVTLTRSLSILGVRWRVMGWKEDGIGKGKWKGSRSHPLTVASTAASSPTRSSPTGASRQTTRSFLFNMCTTTCGCQSWSTNWSGFVLVLCHSLASEDTHSNNAKLTTILLELQVGDYQSKPHWPFGTLSNISGDYLTLTIWLSPVPQDND